MPVINPEDLLKHSILITGCEYIEVENIEMTGGSGGIYFTWLNEKREFHHFAFRNLYIHDCYLSNGSAFQFNQIPKGENRMSEYSDILIENCRVNMIVRSAVMVDCLNNVKILNNEFKNTGGPGVVLHKSRTGLISGNLIHSTGSNAHPSFKGRGSCSWMLLCSDMIIEENSFVNAHGWLDSYGFHLDIGNTNCIIQYNISMNNAGEFVQVLGKSKN